MEAVLKRTAFIKEDIKLVEECQLGYKDAFTRLVRKYQDRIYSIAFRMLKNPEEAKDVTQDVFLSVYRSIKRFRRESKLSTWLYRIVINSCINRLKSKSQAVVSVGDYSGIQSEIAGETQESRTHSEPDDPYHALSKKNLREALEKEIARLPYENRIVIIMKDVQRLSYEEIEEIVGIPLGTVKSRLHRGRMELKKKLSKLL